MSVPISEAIFQMGSVEQRFFSKDCEPGDTETFNISFPTPFPAQGVRVIVTANSLNVPRGAHNAAVVGIAQQVTPTGFVLRARNSDCADTGGFAGMNWMAVLETPGIQQKPVNLRMGVLQPNPSVPIVSLETQETSEPTSVLRLTTTSLLFWLRRVISMSRVIMLRW